MSVRRCAVVGQKCKNTKESRRQTETAFPGARPGEGAREESQVWLALILRKDLLGSPSVRTQAAYPLLLLL